MNKKSDFIPSDDIYPSFTLERLLQAIEEKHGKDFDPAHIQIDITCKQYKCFGYDQYDSDDYRIELDFSEIPK